MLHQGQRDHGSDPRGCLSAARRVRRSRSPARGSARRDDSAAHIRDRGDAQASPIALACRGVTKAPASERPDGDEGHVAVWLGAVPNTGLSLGASYCCSLGWQRAEAARDPRAIGVVERDELAGDDLGGLVHLFRGRGRVLVNQQASKLP